MRCNCESIHCLHGQQGASCELPASGSVAMDGLGPVCDRCAGTIIATGGLQWLRYDASFDYTADHARR